MQKLTALALSAVAAVTLSGRTLAQSVPSNPLLSLTVIVTNPVGNSPKEKVENGIEDCAVMQGGLLTDLPLDPHAVFQGRCLILTGRNRAVMVTMQAAADEADLKTLAKVYPRTAVQIESLCGTLDIASQSRMIEVVGPINMAAIAKQGGRVLNDLNPKEPNQDDRVRIVDSGALFAIGQANFDKIENTENGLHKIQNGYMPPVRITELIAASRAAQSEPN